MASRIRVQALAALLLLAACSGAEPTEVRTPIRAVEVAQANLRAAGLDEQVVSSNRHGPVWTVVTRSAKSPKAGHVVTVEAATGRVSFEKYQDVQIGFGRPPA